MHIVTLVSVLLADTRFEGGASESKGGAIVAAAEGDQASDGVDGVDEAGISTDSIARRPGAMPVSDSGVKTLGSVVKTLGCDHFTTCETSRDKLTDNLRCNCWHPDQAV